MVEPAARIRPFETKDTKWARFYIGKCSMEGLTAANVKLYTNPLIVSLRVGLSCIMIELMGWWPRNEHGWSVWLRPIPAFACMALPIMFASDWFNRPSFETLMQQTIRKPDLVDISAYYSRSPASGFWILEYGSRFVGLIAVDASKDSTRQELVISETKTPGLKPSYEKGTSDIALIRHFYVEEPYRAAFMQDDLLQFALKHVWENDKEKKVNVVKAVDPILTPYVGKALRKEGFKSVGNVGSVGILGWELRDSELKRKD